MGEKKNTLVKASVYLLLIISIFYIMSNLKLLRVSGESMAPTLKDNQIRIIKLTKNVDIDDIVVFNKGKETYVKRVIALNGDTVNLKDGRMYINDILQTNYNYEGEDRNYKIKENEMFVIGDNYNNSIDSRNFGAIDKENLIGKV